MRGHALLSPLVVLALAGCPQRAMPVTPGALQYATRTGWAPAGEQAAGYRPLVEAARAAGVELTPDPGLADVAEEIARRILRDTQGRSPSAQTVQALTWRAGLTDPVPTVLAYRGSVGMVRPDVAGEVAALVRSDGLTHVGVSQRREGDLEALVVTLSQRRARIEPVARTASRGARVAVRGALLAGLRAPVLLVTRPDGRVEESPLGAGPDFYGQIPMDTPGVWQVELGAESSAGSTVVALFPVYVDVPVTATPEERSEASREDPGAVASSLRAMINEARTRAGLRPLAAMPSLDAVAEAHAQDMATRRYIAHNAPDGSTPGDRLRRAGLRSGLALENVARGYGAREIHEGLMGSPGHRANILNPTVTHLGLGVVREEGSGAGLVVTQNFIEVAAALDLPSEARSLEARVNALRAQRGLRPFRLDPVLQRAAQSAAQGFFDDPRRSQQEALDDAARPLQREGLTYRRVGVAAAYGPRLDGADRLEPLFDREMGAMGVGLAQGSRPDGPPNAVFVVYVMAVPR